MFPGLLVQRARLAAEVHWCQQYAAINRIALQRLTEQYDRCRCSSAGARFLQARSLPPSYITDPLVSFPLVLNSIRVLYI